MTPVAKAAAGAAVVLAVGLGTMAWFATRSGPDCPNAVAGADIGGPFALVDGSGRQVTDEDVITRPSLVYFGYTFCPDVCPMDMARNAEALDLLAERGVDTQGVFITVDPARDTPDVVGAYAGYFGDDVVGLSGSEAQLADAARAYRVYAEVPEDPEDEYYIVNHSAFTYLVTPEDGFVTFFKRADTPEAVADIVACHLG